MAYMLLWGQHTHIDQQNVFDVGIYFNIESIYVYILYCSIKDDIVNVLQIVLLYICGLHSIFRDAKTTL